MVCMITSDPLIQKVCDLHSKISKLDSLSPSPPVDALFTSLVSACIPPHPTLDVSTLCPTLKLIRKDLIGLCATAECLLEKHYSTLLGSLDSPLDHLHLFPYYPNYLKLARVESDLLTAHLPNPARIAFVGSGPLPLTSIVLAAQHLKSTIFHNYDVDPSANDLAERLVGPHPDLSGRMEFKTTDIVDATGLGGYDAVFLAALVGTGAEEKARVVGHLARHMAPGAILVVRSAHGARAFLYPVVDPRVDLKGFEVLSVYHPTDDIINSVVVARKCQEAVHIVEPLPLVPCSKCGGEIRGFNGNMGHRNMMVEEFACQDGHVC